MINEDIFFSNTEPRTGDKELCSKTIEACSRGVTSEFLETILSTSEKSTTAMQDLVAILTAIVEYTKDKELLSVIINFVLEKLLPAAHNKLPVLHASLLAFLATLIVSRWRTFFPGNVLSTIMKQSSQVNVNHLDILTKIIESFSLGISST